MIRIKSMFSLNQICILALLFLASMNFLEKYFYFVFMAVGVMLIAHRKIKADITAGLLFVFALAYVLFFPETRSSLLVMLKPFSYPLCYLVGLNFLRLNEERSQDVPRAEKHLTAAVLSVALGSFMHFFLNMMLNQGSLLRNTIDVWSGHVFSATGQASLAVIALGVFWTVLFSKVKLKWKAASAVGIVVVFAYNLVLSGRSLLVLNFLLFVVAFLFSASQSDREHRWRLWITVIVAVLFVVLALYNNWFGITESIGGSNFMVRFEEQGLFEDTRFSIKGEYLGMLLSHPFGGGHIYNEIGYYAHDLLLDCYSDAGIVGVTLLLAFLIISVRQSILLVTNKAFSISCRLLVLCVNVSIFFIFFMEPVFAGMQWLFCSFCFFQGIVTKSYRLQTHESEEAL